MKIRGFEDTISWYNKNAKRYGEVSKAISFEGKIIDFLEKLPSNPRILEAGCGAGRDAKVFQEKGARITAVDISEGLLEVARQENPDIQFIQANFLNLPFEDSSFDGVWSHASLVHLEKNEDIQKVLSEFHRVLHPGGFLYIFTRAQAGEEETAIVTDSLANHDRFFRYYKAEQLTELLQETGFVIESHTVENDPHGREEVRWLRFLVQKPMNSPPEKN